MIAGRLDKAATAFAISANNKYVSRFPMPDGGVISKATIYLDGLGGGLLGPQACKAVVYNTDETLLAVSDEEMIAVDQPPGWVDFMFTPTGNAKIPAGDFFLGVHAGSYDGTIRAYRFDPHGMGSLHNADTYADGPANPFGAASGYTGDMSAFLTYFPAFAPSSLLTDLDFSRLPVADAQKVLGAAGPVRGSARPVALGWHSNFIDPEVGSNAVVRSGSEFEDLLGERILVTTQGVAEPRSVVAYVHNVVSEDSLLWDVSITRALFGRIAMLAETTVPVVVEVLA